MVASDEYIRKEMISDVLSVIANLSQVQKQIITYRFLDELSINETAEVMQIP